MIRSLLILAVSISAFTSSFLFAGEKMPEYANVDGWSIRVDTTLDDGCFVYAEYEGGTILRLGIDNREGGASMYVLFGDEEWKSIEYGKEYEVQIQFGNESKWEGEAEGTSFDPPKNEPFLWVNISNDKDISVSFIAEFMKEQSVELFYNNSSIALLKLKGSYAAGLKLIECQKVMNETNKDPFSTPAKSKDPFKA